MQSCGKHAVSFFELWVITILIIILIIPNEVREVTSQARSNAACLHSLNLTLLSDLVSTARAASCGTTRHFDFPRGPVYLGVMLLKPRVPENEVLTP
jgi:hypothetical protein